MESVIRDKPFGRIIKNMCDEAKNVCSVLYNSAYYLDKKEQPFSDFPILLYLQEKNKTPSIENCYRNDRVARDSIGATGEAMKLNIKRELPNCIYFCVLSVVQTVV